MGKFARRAGDDFDAAIEKLLARLRRREKANALAMKPANHRVAGAAGAHIPKMATISKPGRPDAATVGRPGASCEGVALVTASALNLPAFTCAVTDAALGNMRCTRFAIKSTSAGADPLYGT